MTPSTAAGEKRIPIRTGSFCSGIAAPEVAAVGLGFSPRWFSEIDPFPCDVLAARHPGVPNLGDMTKLNGADLEPVDLVVAGTPCQSFSVAGLRKGMADPRGNLALVFLGLVDAMRPRWLVWENVPGVLSSAGGRDFGSFLGALGQLGYGWSYRIADAQYFGVPQRRRRVFVVGYLGDWRRAAAVLFERHGLSGHPTPSRKAGSRSSPAVAASTGEISHCLNADGMGRQDYETETASCIRTRPPGSMDNSSTTVVAMQCHGSNVGEMGTLRAGNGNQSGGVPFIFQTRIGRNGRGAPDSIAPALTASAAGTHADSKPHVAGGGYGVRRLTPRECERLQGFPDDYTLITRKGKPAADAPRYKALGNSMAVPVMRWIQERIVAVDAIL